MSTRNHNQRAPGPEDRTNRYDRPVFEYQIAQPRDVRDRTRRAHEEMRAEEGLGWQPEYAGAFADSVNQADDGTAHETFERIQAGQAAGRSKLASGRMVPVWTTEAAYTGSFFQGASGDQDWTTGQQWPSRPGANPRPLAPTFGLSRGERPTSIVVRKQAPPIGGRGVRNEAVVSD